MTLILDMAEGGRAGAGPAAEAPPVAVSISARFEDVEAAWRLLEREAVHTPYQRFDWQRLFHRHLGAGEAPCLAVLSDSAGTAQALLPLAVRRYGGLSVASFIGGKHANFAMGLWRPGFARRLTAPAVLSILRAVAAEAPQGIDLFRLTGQPVRWAGLDNPLSRIAHQPSASFGYHLALGPDADAVLGRVVSSASRRKLKRKERLLAEQGELAFKVASSPEEVVRFVDLFLAWKAARFRALGIADVFDVPGMRDFIVAAALEGLERGDPAVEICALTVGGEPVALFGGTVAAGRFSAMFNAMTPGPMMRESPGELLLHRLIRHCCARGLAVFDLGAGEAQYKANICDGTDPLFDQFVPMTARGRLAAAALGAAARAKRRVKQSPRLWSLAQRLRRLRAGTGA